MADPISLTLAAVGVGSTVAGGVTSAIGAKYSGEAKANMYEYQSGIAQLNEQIQKQNAAYARSAGEVSASEVGQKTAQTVGLIRTGQGASGIDVNAGTATKVQEGQLRTGQFEEAITRSNAARQAYGFETGALSEEASSKLATMGAEASRTAGDINATSSILGTVGSVANKWYAAAPSFGTSTGGNAFLPSESFMNNSWGW